MRQPTGSHHQNPLVQGGQIAADRRAERPATMQRPQRGGDRVDEDRYHRARRRGTEQLLQRLDGAVVDVHVRRYRDVDAGGQDRFRAGDRGRLGNVQRPFVGAVVADSLRFGANAERWHQLVEEAVVVVGSKDDDDLRVEVCRRNPLPARARRRCRQGGPATALADSAAGCGTYSTGLAARFPPGVKVRTSKSEVLSSGAS